MSDHVDATWPRGRGTHVHHIQASKAFGPGGGAHPGRVVAYLDSTALVERVPEGPIAALAVARPGDFARTLAREDLTVLDGAPLVLLNTGYGVLGVATGPTTPPARLSVVLATRLEDGHSVEIPASDPAQPSWQLFAVKLADPSGL